MEYWNSGKMEYWVSKTDDGQILISGQCHQYKIRSHSAKRGTSVFQHSIVPVFHGIRIRQLPPCGNEFMQRWGFAR